jgi:glycosyltransferase involved in cell wall biosynthesis
MDRQAQAHMKPLVSVVVPAYNAGPFIGASVQSALTQSFPDIEVIVVNDGSTDNTVERLSAFDDPRLRLIEQSNQGYASALNAGIRAAQGPYLGILDADDVWLPAKLARHIQLHKEQPQIDLTFSWVHVIDIQGRPVQMPCPRWRGTISFPQLLADYVIRTSSAVVMRRAAVEEAGPFDSTLMRCIDFEFFLRVSLLRANNICAIQEVLTSYRRHAAQRTRDWRRVRQGWNQMLASIRPRAPEQVARIEKLASSNMHRYYASIAYEGGNFREALQLIGRSFSLSPIAFMRDSRNWKTGAAAIAGLTLPRTALLAVERTAGYERPAE